VERLNHQACLARGRGGADCNNYDPHLFAATNKVSRPRTRASDTQAIKDAMVAQFRLQGPALLLKQ
jgi:hypothetical protein